MLTSLAVTVFSFALYQPSAIIAIETIFSRCVVTFSNGESRFALINQGAAWVYRPDVTADIRLRLNKDAIEVDCIIPKEDTGSDSFRGRGAFQILRNEPADYFRQSIRQKYDLSLLHNGERISSEDGIVLESSASMNLENIILQSPLVALFAKRYTFNNCVCEAETLVIATKDPNSWYDSIQFVFAEHEEVPHTVCGAINFETGSGEFTVLGIKEIKIQLSERAFSSEDGPIPVIPPGGKLF